MKFSSSRQSISSAGWNIDESLFFFSSSGSKGGTYLFLLVTWSASGLCEMILLGGNEFLVILVSGEEGNGVLSSCSFANSLVSRIKGSMFSLAGSDLREVCLLPESREFRDEWLSAE